MGLCLWSARQSRVVIHMSFLTRMSWPIRLLGTRSLARREEERSFRKRRGDMDGGTCFSLVLVAPNWDFFWSARQSRVVIHMSFLTRMSWPIRLMGTRSLARREEERSFRKRRGDMDGGTCFSLVREAPNWDFFFVCKAETCCNAHVFSHS